MVTAKSLNSPERSPDEVISTIEPSEKRWSNERAATTKLKRVNNDLVINKSQIQYAGADVRVRRVHIECEKMEKKRRRRHNELECGLLK